MVSNASAQVPELNVSPWQKKSPTPPEERERQKKLDDAYKAATKNIPNQIERPLGRRSTSADHRSKSTVAY
jgi:hypothetical protein